MIIIGYVASALVFLTFYMNDMVWLRAIALVSNCAFLAYGIGLHLGPVILLHSILLPLNTWRLTQCLKPNAKFGIVDLIRRVVSAGGIS